MASKLRQGTFVGPWGNSPAPGKGLCDIVLVGDPGAGGYRMSPPAL